MPSYKRGMETLYRILRELALNQKVEQYKLPKTTGVSYRTVLRQLKLLKSLGFARVAEQKRSQKRGKEKNIWGITFLGIMAYMRNASIKEIDQIAKVHKDKWIVFQEWDYLSRDSEIKNLVIRGILRYAGEHGLEIPKPNFTHLKEVSKTTQIIMRYIGGSLEELYKKEATECAFYLDIIFKYKAWLPWLEKGKHKINKLWHALLLNPSIRQYIMKRFEEEKIRIEILKKYESFFKRLMEETK